MIINSFGTGHGSGNPNGIGNSYGHGAYWNGGGNDVEETFCMGDADGMGSLDGVCYGGGYEFWKGFEKCTDIDFK